MGRLIDQRYDVIDTLGSGGMADVYLARDGVLGRDVALKVLNRRFSGDWEFVERFRREARSAATLSHPMSCPSTTGARQRTERVISRWSTCPAAP